MSERAERDRIRKQSWAAPGGAHDWVVRLLKFGLPAAVGLLAAYLAVVPLRRSDEVSFIFDKNKAEVAKERLRVTSARYRGQDDLGRPFSVDAQGAVQATSRVPVVDINGMSARLGLEDGPAVLTADNGRYDLDREVVDVTGPILFTAPDGYRMETRDVSVDLNKRLLQSEGNVAGRVPLGTFTADSLKADLGARTVVLDGRARIRIEQNRAR